MSLARGAPGGGRDDAQAVDALGGAGCDAETVGQRERRSRGHAL